MGTGKADAGTTALVLPYPPSANRYWRMVNGRMLVSREARAYKLRASLVAIEQGAKPCAGPVGVELKVYRPAKRGDLDNSIKVCLDSLKGIAFEDDNQIIGIIADRYDDKANPRVEVTVTELDLSPAPRVRTLVETKEGAV